MLQSNHLNDLRSAYPGEYKPNFLVTEVKLDSKGRSATKGSVFQNVATSENDFYFKVEIAAPGLSREDFLVQINGDGNLLVSAMHIENQEESSMGKTFYNRFIGFTKEISLPENIDTDFVKAECVQGILSIWFLKTNKIYPKRMSTVAVY